MTVWSVGGHAHVAHVMSASAEWFFRSALDRYVWIWGMAVAWIHPHVESAWAKIDGLGITARSLCRAAILSCCVALFHVWYTNVYTLEKLEYNRVHPYTSWLPISLWVIVRNLTPQLREHSLAFLGWLGCITLETYISQFHIWLRSVIPNGQPKYLLQLVRSSSQQMCQQCGFGGPHVDARLLCPHAALCRYQIIRC